MEEQKPQSTSGDSITFDYNQLYAQNAPTTPVEEPVQVVEPTNFQQAPVVIPAQQQVVAEAEKEIVKNVVPTFDVNALEGNEDAANQALINSMRNDTQIEDAEYKKNMIFIAVFFGVLIVAVLFLFPIIAGYK